MKIYLLMLSTDCNQYQVTINAYQDRDKAKEHADMWNREKEVVDRKNANENGVDYYEWRGAYADEVYVVEVDMDTDYESVRDTINKNIS